MLYKQRMCDKVKWTKKSDHVVNSCNLITKHHEACYFSLNQICTIQKLTYTQVGTYEVFDLSFTKGKLKQVMFLPIYTSF